MKYAVILIALLVATPKAMTATMQRDGILFDADEASIETGPNNIQLIKLRGRVQIVFQTQHLSCDAANIDTGTKQVEAIGNILLTSPSATVEGDRLFLNYKDQTGVVHNGYLQSGQVRFEGDVIRKTGPQTYEATSGHYTSCTTCPPSWSFSGSRMTAEMGGYTYIRNPILRFGKVPVFWLPYLVVPLKSERQSGFLFPVFEFAQTSGLIVSPTFFWAMSRHHDSTWTLKNYDLRGLKGQLEYRYALTETAGGTLHSSYMRDRVLNLDRWLARYDHIQDLPNGYSHRANINLASDTLYPRDFPTEFEGQHGLPALDNRLSLSKNLETVHASVDTSYYLNLLKSDLSPQNDDAVHRFPEVRISTSPQRIGLGHTLMNLDLNYANFARDGFSYDDTSINTQTGYKEVQQTGDGRTLHDGRYDPATDTLRTGQRFDFRPRLSYPFKIGEYVDILPSVTYRETAYLFAIGPQGVLDSNGNNIRNVVSDSAERRLTQTRVSLRTRLSQIYGDPSARDNPSFRHEIQPEVTHTAIPWLQSTDHPIFGSKDVEPFFRGGTAISDKDSLQFDYEDRLVERNISTFALNNRLIRKRWHSGTAEYKQIALFRIAQSYDFYEQYRQTSQARQPWSDVSFFTDVRLDRFETNSLVRFYPYQNTTSTAARAKLSDERGNYIQINYSQDFLISEGSTINMNSRTEDIIGALGVQSRMLNIEANVSYSFINYRIPHWGFKFEVIPPGNCWRISTQIRKPAESEPVVGFNFTLLFDGKTDISSGTSQNQQTVPGVPGSS